MKKPKMRTWLVTTTTVGHFPGDPPAIREISRHTLEDERDPALTMVMQWQVQTQEIAYVKPKAARKGRRK